ncbi:MAG: ABC transporter ATP-binding protein [Chitinophagaceae bacterium]|nr:ABC transporter ATP-binding protein [Chitinophagaceae bacterium]
MATIIKVDNLSKQYGDFTAVNNLSFTVNEGDVYGFLGQNGAGKSTTIRMLLTLIKPTGGSINLFGKELTHHRSEILRQTGAVIERPDLYKYLSAYNNLSIFAKMSGIRVTKKLLMNQLQMVGLDKVADKKAALFSQGMKQRLGIAVALVHDPKLIILDEPTNGLDPQGIADMRNLIVRLCKEMGKTVVISSHLLSEVEQIATRMIIIHKGEKIVEGSVDELLDPSHTAVELETTDNTATQQLLQSTKWNNYLQPDKQLQLMMNKELVPELINELVDNNVQILSVNSSHSLENYFLSLTTQTGYVEAFAN